ncbi:MAG TPA: PAS domain-containing protein [Ferrovibrio sp.]|uniref:PAS domain-containing protein n=1 Tax=Ferrovibrio sp. TaxID=1917215 RepID=UPI002B4B53B4|nr:PAS domain-containing protein [Ferrovibrio sp.]HLT78125.1 PAS domain-containing protein [Ferrovibrio sp.]
MSLYRVTPTNRELFFGEDEIIVSKTDEKGRILYANDVFVRVSGYSENELVGAPHSILRHPDMPRCVFWLLWETIANGEEIFAYVKNMAKTGDFYWVFAHVTPSYDENGRISGYHSNRRAPTREAVNKADALYGQLLAVENQHEDRKQGMHAGIAMMLDLLKQNNVTYGEFVFSL